MSRKDQFILLVQTWVLLYTNHITCNDSLLRARFATGTLSDAMLIPEESIPTDESLDVLCEQYCRWQSRDMAFLRPEWLPIPNFDRPQS